jgi:hypothetical protein
MSRQAGKQIDRNRYDASAPANCVYESGGKYADPD